MTLKPISKTTDDWEGSLALAQAVHKRYGLPCIPVYGDPKPDDPTTPKKYPILSGWQKNLPKTPEDITALWNQAKGRAKCYLVGIPCAGLIVIDVDTAEHKNGIDGRAQWEAWESEYGKTPTLTVQTQSGGLHIYYRLPAGRRVINGTSKLADGIDHKTAGGQVVGPGNYFTINGEVRGYKIVAEGPVEAGYIADAPEWLLEKLEACNAGAQEAASLPCAPTQTAAALEADLDINFEPALAATGASVEARTTAYINNTLAKVCSEISTAKRGTRNQTLDNGALRVLRLWEYGTKNNGVTTDQSKLLDALYKAGVASGLLPTDVKSTIGSAIKGVAKYGEPDAIRKIREDVVATAKPASVPTTAALSAPVHVAAQSKATVKTDYTAYYTEKAQILDTRPEGREWLASRGISLETAHAMRIGYDPLCDPINAPGIDSEELPYTGDEVRPSQRVIVPTGPAHFLAVSIDPSTPEKYKELSPKGSHAGVFNLAALSQEEGCVFVTDTWLNALSYIEAGAVAIATLTAKGAGELLKQVIAKKPTATLILAYSNTEAGRGARDILKNELHRRNVSYLIAGQAVTGKGDVSREGVETPNDLLVFDKESFLKAVQEIQKQAGACPDNTLSYLENAEFARDIRNFQGVIKTGYESLDAVFGGLYPGLYVIGAISSLGKTTYIHQMCDQIAAYGPHVLFFSMEMSRMELVSKSLARRTYQANQGSAWTSLGIRKGQWNDAVFNAIETYKQTVGNRISIIEGNFDVDMSYISDYVRRYVRKNQARVVVVIDYLQIVQPSHSDTKQTAKQLVDLCVTEMKRLSRDLSIPVIAISSLNRTNYMTPIDFDAFKESGGIEYTADVVWGMQLACLEDEEFQRDQAIIKKKKKIQEEKSRDPRQVEIVCLKNRYGKIGTKLFYSYYPKYDYFEECAEGIALNRADFLDGYEKDDLNAELIANMQAAKKQAEKERDFRSHIPGYDDFMKDQLEKKRAERAAKKAEEQTDAEGV